MTSSQSERTLQKFDALILDLYDIAASYRQNDRIVYSLAPIIPPDRAMALLRERLTTAGYTFELDGSGEQARLVIDPQSKLVIPPLNVALFFTTLVTVYIVPVLLFQLSAAAISLEIAYESLGIPFPDPTTFNIASFFLGIDLTLQALADGAGLEFTLALMSILLVHEMGHYLASRRRNIVTSWPYFIPAPTFIGTMGAIIKSKSPFWNRRDLIEVGAAGPIAGWIVALIWLGWGLGHSAQLPPEAVPLGQFGFQLSGESILMRTAIVAFLGQPLAGMTYALSEAAFAGWVGLLITAINMLPIGQLDGGHILYGLTRRIQHKLSRLAMVALVLLGFLWPGWWLFGLVGLIFGMNHPPTIFDDRPLPRHAVVMGVAALVILVVSFTPMPFPSPWQFDFQFPWQ